MNFQDLDRIIETKKVRIFLQISRTCLEHYLNFLEMSMKVLENSMHMAKVYREDSKHDLIASFLAPE